MGHRGSPCGHALSPAHAMPVLLRPDTRNRRPVATGTPVDPVVRMSHCLSRSQNRIEIGPGNGTGDAPDRSIPDGGPRVSGFGSRTSGGG